MARKRLPEEYQHPASLEAIGDKARSGAMPIADALAMLHRSSKLSQEFIDAVSADAAKGYQWGAIAARVGISPRTLANWLRRGKDRREAIDDWGDKRRTLPDDCDDDIVAAEIGECPVEDDLCLLYDSCARAHANAECELVDVIHASAVISGNTNDAKWLLTSRFDGWKPAGKIGRNEPENEDESNCSDAVDRLAAKIAAFDERARAITAASTNGS